MKVRLGKKGEIYISDFSSVQAYKIAVKTEASGIVFYNDLRKKAAEGAVRRELEALIREEETHRGVFESLLDEERGREGDAFEEDDIVSFMKVPVFDPAEEEAEAKRIKSGHTALEEARLLEERSIAFYEQCLQATKNPNAKKAFQNIIGEEKRHLATVAEWMRERCLKDKKGCLL